MVKKGVVIALPVTRPASEEPSDEVLLAACGKGDKGALATLFDRHQALVARVLSRLTWGSASDVEDLLQSTFLEVWRSAPRFKGDGTGRAFVLGIAANLARHYVRGEARRRQAMGEWASRIPAAGGHTEAEVSARQLIAKCRDALAELPQPLREAFVLCELEGLSGNEVARATGCREGTVWRRLHDARKALRDVLGGES